MEEQSSKKKTLVIIIVVMVVAIGLIIGGIIYIYNLDEEEIMEKQYEEAAEIINEQASMTSEEVINKEEKIAEIKSIVSTVMSGNNLDGMPYLINNMSDLRLSKEEEYFSQVEFWADDYPWADISLEESDIMEYKAIMLKCSELFKALFEEDHKIGYARCQAFLDDDAYNAVFSATIEDEQEAQVDWSQDAQTLADDVLPSIWQIGRNDYWIYDDDL